MKWTIADISPSNGPKGIRQSTINLNATAIKIQKLSLLLIKIIDGKVWTLLVSNQPFKFNKSAQMFLVHNINGNKSLGTSVFF